eukprot:g1009.t1
MIKSLLGTRDAPRLISQADAFYTPALVSALRRDGFARLPAAVPPELVDSALREINRELGAARTGTEKFKARSFPAHKDITNLFNKSCLPFLLMRLLGGSKPYRQERGQLALRFPGDLCPGNSARASQAVFDNTSFFWHIDGCPNDFIPGITDHYGTVKNFDCLVGVLLSDTDAPLSGELCCWPGSHDRLAGWVAEGDHMQQLYTHGMKALPNGAAKTKSIFKGIRPVNCNGKKGDVFIANYMTAHFIAPNQSPHIRYAVYFRVSKQGVKRTTPDGRHDPSSMLIPWQNWFPHEAGAEGKAGRSDTGGERGAADTATARGPKRVFHPEVPAHLLPSPEEQREIDLMLLSADNAYVAPPSLRPDASEVKSSFLGRLFGGHRRKSSARGEEAETRGNSGEGGKADSSSSSMSDDQQLKAALVSSMLEEMGMEGVSMESVVSRLEAHSWDENEALGSFF